MFSGIKSDIFLEFCSIPWGKYRMAMTRSVLCDKVKYIKSKSKIKY